VDDSRGARLLVVDDHPMVREGLRSMLAGDGIEILGEAGTGEDAIRLAVEMAPDLVLLDVELPDLDGLAVLSRLKSAAPRVAVLVVSMHGDPALVRRAVELGAAGYVLKGIGRRELRAAVRAVLDGDSVLDPALLRSLVAATDLRAQGEPRLREPLTAVERDVLRLVADGLTNGDIAARLRWSVGTAKKYVQRILEKLEVSDRTQAAVAALRLGLLE
jgi:DNA-binding NarL/FixJ family response regulator